MASSSLYPPIVPYSMPAFVCQEQGESDSNNIQQQNTSVRIYFALSSYNKFNEIRQAHVTVRYQSNNTNALDTASDAYPAQIMVCNVGEVSVAEDPVRAATAERFYVEIASSDLADGFQPNVTYKVQIRFSDLNQTNPVPLGSFTENLNHYSEWSTVCLIRGIIRPKIKLVGLDDETESGQSQEIEAVVGSVDSIFMVSYIPGDSEETLRNWRAELLDINEDVLIDSGWHIYNSYDNLLNEYSDSVSFEIVLPYQMSPEETYYLRITYETKNRYVGTKTIKFSVAANAEDTFPGSITAYIVEEEGYAVVELSSNDTKIVKNLTLRRSSSKSNFTIWEDIANTTIVNESLNWKYYDFTIESGVFYQYGVQTRDTFGRRGLLKLSERTMGEFEDAFLLEGGQTLTDVQQLKLRYNFNISNFVRTVAESKTDTIGSQYPFVRRNGNMYYREFQCTGLITGYMDNAMLFADKAQLYNNYQAAYDEIRNTIELMYNQYDYTYEREFRRAVEAFLYDGKVKLFKSLQEGNILVKVMNVSLTPKQELGRLLYDFSATLVEVDDASFENLNKYGFITIGDYNPNITLEETNLLKRLPQTSFPVPNATGTNAAQNDLFTIIGNNAGYGTVVDGKRVENFYLTYLRLEIESDPYLIQLNNGMPRVIDDNKSDNVWEKMDTEEWSGVERHDDTVVGWLFKFNGEYLIIEPPNNIYELKGDNIYLQGNTSSLIPMAPVTMQTDFVLNLTETEDTSRIASKKIYTKINGQYINHFPTSENAVKTIWYKYYIDYYSEDGNSNEEETYYTQLIAIFTIEVDAEPGTIIQARSSAMDNLTTFVVGETGILYLDPGSLDYTIEELYVRGTRLDARYILNKYDGTRTINDDALAENNSSLIEFNEQHNRGAAAPEHPILYDYYLTDGDNGFMYYRGQWCPMTVSVKQGGQNVAFDISIDTDAMLFYYAQTVKGIY